MGDKTLRYSRGSSDVTTNGLSLYNRKNASDSEYYGERVASSVEQDVRGIGKIVNGVVARGGDDYKEDRAQADVGRRVLRERR